MGSGVTEPKILICKECNEEFIFTIAAQEYFFERGYTEDPKRCKTCHTQHKKTQRQHKPHREKAHSHSGDQQPFYPD